MQLCPLAWQGHWQDQDLVSLVVLVATSQMHAQASLLQELALIHLHNTSLLYNELSLLVLLSGLERHLILPTQIVVADCAVDVGNCVQSSQQHAVFSRAQRYIHHIVHQVCTPCTSLERLRNNIIVISCMSFAVGATVDVRPREILLV